MLKRCSWSALALLIGMTVGPVPAASSTPPAGPLLVAEPGFPDRAGNWVLPFTVDPAAADAPAAADLKAWRDEQSLSVTATWTYPLDGGGRPSAIAILLDPTPLPADVAAAWAAELARLLDREATPGALVTVAACGETAAEFAKPGSAAGDTVGLAEFLVAPAAGRLWDGVLAAIRALLDDDLPDRRVVLVVSDGREEIPSRLVLASCIDAALRARVAVHVLSLAGDGQEGAARLRELSARTGGRLLTGAEPTPSDLALAVEGLGSAAGLQLRGDGAVLPVDIGLGTGDEPRWAGTIASRRGLGGSRWWRWPTAGASLLIAAGAAYLLWRQRAVVLGDLMIRTRKGVRRFPVPKHGVTIGRAADNNLVLASSKVSQHHAVIRCRHGDLIITDLRSRLGTQVNGESIGSRPLQTGDRIVIAGIVVMEYREARGSG